MSDRPDDAASLLESQRMYYDERADDYGDESKPDRKTPGLMTAEDAKAIVDDLAPAGHVLELACGTGGFTHELVRHAESVTAVDASSRMLAINERQIDNPNVTYVQADLFAWKPDRAYDAVFFGFWLSHVPPAAFDDFWALVRSCLAPGGLVAFVDEDDRGAGNDEISSIGGVPAARRTLHDGRSFNIVKMFWRPDDLEKRLRTSGWDIDVRRWGATFLYGVGSGC